MSIWSDLNAFLSTPAGAYIATLGVVAFLLFLWLIFKPLIERLRDRWPVYRRLTEPPTTSPADPLEWLMKPTTRFQSDHRATVVDMRTRRAIR